MKIYSYSNNCPIREFTADGVAVGRCWVWLIEGRCDRHGDVSEAQKLYAKTGQLTNDPRALLPSVPAVPRYPE